MAESKAQKHKTHQMNAKFLQFLHVENIFPSYILVFTFATVTVISLIKSYYQQRVIEHILPKKDVEIIPLLFDG